MTDETRYFVPVPEWIVLAGLTPQALALYTVLLSHVNRERGDNLAWPSMDTLATILGFGKRQSIIRYLGELERRGAVTVETRACATGRRNFYTVHRDPPEGYAGFHSIARFHDAEREARGRLSPTGDNGSSSLGDGGWSPTGDKNQTKLSRRRESYESSTAGDEGASSGPRTSSLTRLKIHLPANFDRLPTDGLSQFLIKAAVGAARSVDVDLDEEAKSRFGQAVKHHLEQGTDRRELVGMMETSLNAAWKGQGEWAWMFGYQQAS